MQLRLAQEEQESLSSQLDEAVDVVSGLHERLRSERDQASQLMSEHSELKALQERTHLELEKALAESRALQDDVIRAEEACNQAMVDCENAHHKLAGEYKYGCRVHG